MKGAMVLEYPMKMVLYLVVLMVVISIIYYLSGNAKSLISDISSRLHHEDNNDETIKVSVGTASWDTITKYAKMCDDKVSREELLDYKLCYVLTGDFSSITPQETSYDVECQDWLTATAVIIAYNPAKGNVVIDC